MSGGVANSVDWTLEDKNVLEECAYPCSERCDGSYMALQPRWLCFLLLAILIFLSSQAVGGCLSNLGSAEPPGSHSLLYRDALPCQLLEQAICQVTGVLRHKEPQTHREEAFGLLSCYNEIFPEVQVLHCS